LYRNSYRNPVLKNILTLNKMVPEELFLHAVASTSGQESIIRGHNNDHELALTQDKEEMELAMSQSLTGKAWAFVREVLEEHNTNIVSDKPTDTTTKAARAISIEPISMDNML
jgi:hypothetical protein